MTDQPTHHDDIDTVARWMAASAIDHAATTDLLGHEDFPDIGEWDFELALGRAQEVAASIRPQQEQYLAAYEALKRAAEDWAECNR